MQFTNALVLLAAMAMTASASPAVKRLTSLTVAEVCTPIGLSATDCDCKCALSVCDANDVAVSGQSYLTSYIG